jgi:hypothetical protein
MGVRARPSQAHLGNRLWSQHIQIRHGPRSALCGVMVSSPSLLLAQSPSAGQTPPAGPDGATSGGYRIHSSFELGYRSNNLTGSGSMYDTLVNLQTGPRILEQTLSMQALNHQGVLFDDLYLNSSGWGGDPNNYMRLRASKNIVVQPAKQFSSRPEFFELRLAG